MGVVFMKWHCDTACLVLGRKCDSRSRWGAVVCRQTRQWSLHQSSTLAPLSSRANTYNKTCFCAAARRDVVADLKDAPQRRQIEQARQQLLHTDVEYPEEDSGAHGESLTRLKRVGAIFAQTLQAILQIRSPARKIHFFE